MPDAIANHDVPTLATEIEKTMQGWQQKLYPSAVDSKS
jgi:hypothetical protein